ncbi:MULTISPECIES: single-stranded DNA-binding protein [Nocardia]|uniref:single-stranded DNA-binding protein n=1 Tax=Nocardia TaxID=1817 RepID=UPI0007A48F7D|nr:MULTISPECIES: single-stranded DNA-binding protein [Nocardia]NQE72672.1 Single-stranded DNA-binding protein 1 [Nocardia gamkensis]
MSGDTVITVIGNLVAPAELRFTPNGAAVVNFTVASTPRVFDRQTNEWKDGESLFLRCNLWREAAENLAESDLSKGARVIVVGRLKQRTYETREGEKRYVTELDVEEVGPSLRWATATVKRAARAAGQGNGQQQGKAKASARDDNPWSPPANSSFGGNPPTDEPPF